MTLQTTAAVSPYFSITAAQAAGDRGGDADNGPAGACRPIMPVAASIPTAPARRCSTGSARNGRLHAFVEYQRLTDSVANSPMVTVRGSPNQFTYGLGATYSFNMHPLW